MVKPAASGPRLNLPIFLGALFGVLVVVHLAIQVSRGFTHGCLGFSAPTGEIAGCAQVVQSAFGSFLGITNVGWGLLFYTVVAALRLGVAWTRPPVSLRLRQVSFAVTSVGMLYVAWLLYVQVAALEQFCVLCLISAATTTLLFGLHVAEWRSGRGAGRGREGEPAVAQRARLAPYGVGLAALAFLVAVDVAFFSDRVDAAALHGAPPVQPTADRYAALCTYAEGRLPVFDLVAGGRTAYVGREDAPVRVLKVFDPNCPHCKTLHGVLEQVVPRYTDRARFYYQPMALWEFSVPQVQALYLAREHGHEAFVAMMDLQLEAQQRGGLPVDVLVGFAERIGLDPEAFRADLERGRFADLARQESQMLSGAGVRGVPTLYVDGRPIVNTQATWTPECLGYFIEQAARAGS